MCAQLYLLLNVKSLARSICPCFLELEVKGHMVPRSSAVWLSITEALFTEE